MDIVMLKKYDYQNQLFPIIIVKAQIILAKNIFRNVMLLAKALTKQTKQHVSSQEDYIRDPWLINCLTWVD